MLLEASDWAFCTWYDFQFFEFSFSSRKSFLHIIILILRSLFQLMPFFSILSVFPRFLVLVDLLLVLLFRARHCFLPLKLFFLGGMRSFAPIWLMVCLHLFVSYPPSPMTVSTDLGSLYNFRTYFAISFMAFCDFKMDNFLSIFIKAICSLTHFLLFEASCIFTFHSPSPKTLIPVSSNSTTLGLLEESLGKRASKSEALLQTRE